MTKLARARFLLAAAATISGSALAQATWIVDAANGPGTNFTSVSAAVTAASSGDLILVRRGNYQLDGFATSKGLTIVGVPDFTIFNPRPSGDVIAVQNLPANESFVLSGCSILWSGGSTGFAVRSCQGRVHLHNAAVVSSPWYTLSGGSGLAVVGSPAVTVTGCSFWGAPAALFTTASVDCVSSSINGTGAFTSQSVLYAAGVGLNASGSTVSLSQCNVTGGNGLSSRPGRSAIVASGSALEITGVAGQAISAGTDPNSIPRPAISASSGSIDVDPLLTVAGSHGAQAFAGNATFTVRRVVSLSVAGGDLGGAVMAQVGSPAGNVIALFVGLPVAPTPTPFGAVRVDLSTAIALAFGTVQPASETTAVSFPVPNAPTLAGVTLALQAANIYTTPFAIEMSAAGVVVLH